MDYDAEIERLIERLTEAESRIRELESAVPELLEECVGFEVNMPGEDFDEDDSEYKYDDTTWLKYDLERSIDLSMGFGPGEFNVPG